MKDLSYDLKNNVLWGITTGGIAQSYDPENGTWNRPSPTSGTGLIAIAVNPVTGYPWVIGGGY